MIIDVFGIRCPGSRYSNETELAAVEVKRSRRRASLRYMSQALGYNKLAHYCYLAMPHAYSQREITTAAELGIGLLTIENRYHVRLISQSRRFGPNDALVREFLVRKLYIAQCSICRNLSSLFDIPKGQSREGGEGRKNVFAKKSKWSYFCKQCRERFENLLTERRMERLQNQVRKLQNRCKTLTHRIGELKRRK